MDKAQRTLDTAATIAASDPNSAYTLAYDAARHAGTALLAQQGLRPTSRGGHYAVERALQAQFGQGFRAFGTMRRRRNELEYPDLPDETASTDEAHRAGADTQAMIDAASKLVPAWDCSDPPPEPGQPYRRNRQSPDATKPMMAGSRGMTCGMKRHRRPWS